ncbi:hypothetical protein [Trueperella pyogenes]|nr:hypothetical protein [Trueperella pyogenes]WHU61513.1 hypothetical protein QEV13_02410 [Trueperella pyogenes]
MKSKTNKLNKKPKNWQKHHDQQKASHNKQPTQPQKPGQPKNTTKKLTHY